MMMVQSRAVVSRDTIFQRLGLVSVKRLKSRSRFVGTLKSRKMRMSLPYFFFSYGTISVYKYTESESNPNFSEIRI